MGSVIDFTGRGGDVRYFPMPDDAMLRPDGRGPRARDIIRFRPGLYVLGQPSVCVLLRAPHRVRVGYYWRDETGHHLYFDNPDFEPEHYPSRALHAAGM